MITTGTLNKICGLDINAASDTVLYAAIVTADNASTSNAILTAILIREALTGRSHTVAEVAAATGIDQSSVTRAGCRGEVLYVTGTDTDKGLRTAWAQIIGLGDKALRDLAASLTTVSPDDRTATLDRLTVRAVVAHRLGEKATPEAITSLTDAILSDGNVTPKTAKANLAPVADRLSIALPAPVKRDGAAISSVTGHASDVPNLDAALAVMTKAIDDMVAGVDEANPLMFATVAQRDAFDALTSRMVEIVATATIWVKPATPKKVTVAK